MRGNVIRVVTHAPHLVALPEAPAVTQETAPAASAPSRALAVRVGPITKARRLMMALAQWKRAGLPRASREVRQARDAACAACPLHDPKGNFGWGECRAPGCGCTKFKNYLATSRCTHPEGSRWPA